MDDILSLLDCGVSQRSLEGKEEFILILRPGDFCFSHSGCIQCPFWCKPTEALLHKVEKSLKGWVDNHFRSYSLTEATHAHPTCVILSVI